MPGVTYEQTVQFTPHGAVVLHVITAPRPGDQNGLYQLAPVLARGTVARRQAARDPDREGRLGDQATVAGINGDLFSATDGHPSGHLHVRRRARCTRRSPPLVDRRRLGRRAARRPRQVLRHVEGHRPAPAARTASTRRRRPARSMLFTPAYGARTPRVAGAAEVVLQPFPAAAPNTDLTRDRHRRRRPAAATRSRPTAPS